MQYANQGYDAVKGVYVNSGAQDFVNEHVTMENAKKGYGYAQEGYNQAH